MRILIISGQAWAIDIARHAEVSLYLWGSQPGVCNALRRHEQVVICCWLLIILNDNDKW